MYKAVVIGVSSGGIEALKTLLPALPEDFPLPIAVVQHREHGGDEFLSEFLNRLSKITVCEPVDKEPLQPGHAYLAPAGYHLLIEQGGTFALSVDPPVQFARPSIDVLFESAAMAYGNALIGIVLTGANSDGAKGLREIRLRGGIGIVQNPASAESAAMPRAALDIAGADRVVEINQIAAFLVELSQKKRAT